MLGNSRTPASTSAWQFAHSSTHLAASARAESSAIVTPRSERPKVLSCGSIRVERGQRVRRGGQGVEIAECALLHTVGRPRVTGHGLEPREVDGHGQRRHPIELWLDGRVAGGHQHAESCPRRLHGLDASRVPDGKSRRLAGSCGTQPLRGSSSHGRSSRCDDSRRRRLLNGRVVTLDPARPRATAVAIAEISPASQPPNGGPLRAPTSLLELGGADPAGLGDVDHDAVGAGVLHLDVAVPRRRP